jgi:glycosyltransferase involved in cell wall biosynthesis
MMKVLIVCAAGSIAGKEIVTLELARGLQLSNLDIRLLVSSWGHKDFRQYLTEAGLRYDVLPLGFISATLSLQCLQWTYGQVVRWPALLIGYRALLRTLKPEKVLHTNWQHLLLLFPLLHPRRDLFWVHEVFPNKQQYRSLFRLLSRRLQYFAPVSAAVGESLRRLGIPEKKIRVIHNGLASPDENVERIPNLNEGIRVGIAGQVNRWKGHDDLVQAFGQISTKWPNVELHIYGSGPDDYEHELKRKMAELEIVNKVKWHGFISDRATIFGNLDICVVPSRTEDPLPTVAIEAAIFGVPVIATNRGGLPEIIEDGVTGILVRPEDPDDLAAGIQRLLSNPELRTSMGIQAREHMLRNFSKERFVGEFMSLLEINPAGSKDVLGAT